MTTVWHMPKRHGFLTWTTQCGRKFSVFNTQQAKTMTPKGRWCPKCKRIAGL